MSDRSPPSRSLEDYVLSYRAGPGEGLHSVPESSLLSIPGNAGYPGIDDSDAEVSIGFPFTFDGKTHNRVYVNTNGWCVLISPDYTGSHVNINSHVLTTGVTYANDDISSSFSEDHVVIAPWFDDLRNVYATLRDSGADTYASTVGYPASVLELSEFGKYEVPPGIDSSGAGVKYCQGVDAFGKFLLIRWKSFANYTSPYNIVYFDVTLRENGVIRFGYAPKIVKAPEPATVGATVGVFSHGLNRFRDFSIHLRRNDDTRNIDVNGGCIHDAGYSDIDLGSYSTPVAYGVSLDVSRHWPGQTTFGASFVFAPPARRRMTSRTDVSRRDANTRVISSPGLFDDRKTVPFVECQVEYPSMMPVSLLTQRGYGVSDEGFSTGLFTSGSIRVERSVTPGMYDQIVVDARNDR